MNNNVETIDAKIKINDDHILGEKQSELIRILGSTLVLSGFFADLGLTVENNTVYVVVQPKVIFEDMVKDGEDASKIVLATQVPSELFLSDKNIFTVASAMFNQILSAYIHGGRKIAYKFETNNPQN